MTTAQICSIRKRVGPHLVRSATTPPFGPQEPKEFAVSARCLPAARDASRASSATGVDIQTTGIPSTPSLAKFGNCASSAAMVAWFHPGLAIQLPISF